MSIPQDSNQRLPSLPKYSQKQTNNNMKTHESDRYSFYDPQQEQESTNFYDIGYKKVLKSRDNSANRELNKSKQSSSYRSISIDNQVPGPGSYQPNYDSVFPNSSHQTMPRSPREYQNHEKRPDPCHYNPNEADIYRRKKLGNTRFSQDKRKFFTVKTEYDIGPGQYNIDNNNFTLNTSLSSSKSISFTKTDRKLTKLLESTEPGPGQYNPLKKKLTKNTMFSQSRLDDCTSMYAIHQVVPAVGSYTLDVNKNSKSSPRAVFSSEKRFYVKDKAIPAPNAYKVPSKFDQYIQRENSLFYSKNQSHSRDKIQPITINENSYDQDNNFKQKIFSIKSIKLKTKKLPNQNSQNNK